MDIPQEIIDSVHASQPHRIRIKFAYDTHNIVCVKTQVVASNTGKTTTDKRTRTVYATEKVGESIPQGCFFWRKDGLWYYATGIPCHGKKYHAKEFNGLYWNNCIINDTEILQAIYNYARRNPSCLSVKFETKKDHDKWEKLALELQGQDEIVLRHKCKTKHPDRYSYGRLDAWESVAPMTFEEKTGKHTLKRPTWRKTQYKTPEDTNERLFPLENK